jgi:DNA repair photolyase
MMSFYQSPRWSNEVADCSMPMTFDTYSNCSFGCLYCFSQFQRAIGLAKEGYLKKEVKPVNVNKVKRVFTEPESSQFEQYIKARKVMQWGGLSDQFDGYERKYGVTLQLLKFFKEINYPLCFSTKSVWWTKDSRYMDLFKNQKNWNVKFSIITLDEQKAKVMECGCPTPKERIQAIERIADSGAGGATLRLRPFIIGVSTPSYLDLIKDAATAGATAVSTEFFCMETRSKVLKEKANTFNELCGFDLFQFYKKYSKGSGYLRLNRNVKRPFVEKMKQLCDQLGIRFYVSDAHFKECCSNGSCCGLSEDWNYSRGQWCEALQIAKKFGKVSYSEVSSDVDLLLSSFLWHRAESFNTNSSERRAKFEGMTMAEYMRWLWNNPQAGQSPYKLFGGILVPGEHDERGDIVYYYDASKSL